MTRLCINPVLDSHIVLQLDTFVHGMACSDSAALLVDAPLTVQPVLRQAVMQACKEKNDAGATPLEVRPCSM